MPCSPEDYLRAGTKYPPVTCYRTGDFIGVTITTMCGLLSLISILFVFGIIGRNLWKRHRDPSASLQVFRQPTDVLMASLFLADMVQAIGMVLSIKWVQDGKVETGAFCDAQGIIKIFGASGVALSTLAIAAFTFLGIWANVDASMPFTVSLVACIWSFIGILVGVAVRVNRNNEIRFFGPTPFWCWIDEGLEWKMLLEYLWMWLALFFSILFYVPLYLWMRGNLSIPQGAAWWRFHFIRDSNPKFDARRRKARIMLFYPTVYCVCILPLSAVRWKSFVGGSVPPAATFFGVSVFALSGFFNAFLLVKTRRSSGLFDDIMAPPLPQAGQPDGHPNGHPNGHPSEHPNGHPSEYPTGYPTGRHPDEHPDDAGPADIPLRLNPGHPRSNS